MTRTFILTTVAGLALALAASGAAAQTTGMHAPPSDRTTQGVIIDPNFRPTAGGIVDPNIRKTDGSINYSNGQSPRGNSGVGGGDHGSERMGIVIEERKLVGTTSQTYTPR